jgi:exodeoxyribonuclease-3
LSIPGGAIRVASLYLPNGNPVGTEKLTYKYAGWTGSRPMPRRASRRRRWSCSPADYNVIPEPIDARYPEHWVEDALYQPETRARYRRLLNLGLTCAFRACSSEPGYYTFWDYQAGAWQRNNGIRIDHQLLTPLAADRLRGAQIDKRTRSWDKPSDHVPVADRPRRLMPMRAPRSVRYA